MSETAATHRVPAVEGWFTIDDQPVLLGNTCSSCGTVFFPKASLFCRNPDCDGEQFEQTRLSRRGRIWSYTDARYQPPPPYIPTSEDYQPFALAAVELADEQLVVLGQVADGYDVTDLAVGQPVELVVETLFRDGDTEHVVYRWKPLGSAS